MEPPAKKKKQILPELPYEIWNQILVCIPAKTVIRLKSVCKTWHDLINSHNFQVSHTDTWRNRVPSQLIVKSPYRSKMELLSLNLGGNDDTIPSNVRSSTLRFDQFILRRSQRQLSGGGPTRPKDTTVLDCHDGLFLIRTSKHLYLCNPLTNSSVALPFPKKLRGFTASPHRWAVIYDPSTRGYVIFYVGCDTDHFSRISVVSQRSVVFSLRIDNLMKNGGVGGGRKTGNWRQIWSSENLILKLPYFKVFHFITSISINGKVHWLFQFLKPSYGIYIYENTGILTIDLATEKVIVTKCSATPISGCSFFKSNKKFYCLMEFSNPPTAALELWAIDDVDKPKWVKHHEIVKMGPKMMDFYSLGIVKDGNRLIMRSKDSDSVFIYDITLQKWHVLDIIDSDGMDLWSVLMSINFSVLSWNKLGH